MAIDRDLVERMRSSYETAKKDAYDTYRSRHGDRVAEFSSDAHDVGFDTALQYALMKPERFFRHMLDIIGYAAYDGFRFDHYLNETDLFIKGHEAMFRDAEHKKGA